MKVPERVDKEKTWIQRWEFKHYYSILEVSYLLHIATPQLYDWLRRGKLKGVKVGKHIHIEHDELVRFIDRRVYAIGLAENPHVRVEPYVPREPKGVQVKEAIKRIREQQPRDVEAETVT